MKFRDLSWSHPDLKEKLLRTRKSFLSFKASPTRSLNRMKARAADSSLARSSEETNVNVNQFLRLLQPQPEPNSMSTMSPSLAPESIQNSYLTLTAAIQTKEVDIKSELPSSIVDAAKDLSPPFQALPPPDPDAHLRDFGTISPLSGESVDDIVQTASNVGYTLELTEPRGIPSEAVSIPSIDDPARARYKTPKNSGAFRDVRGSSACGLSSPQVTDSLQLTRSKIKGASTPNEPSLNMCPAKQKDSSRTITASSPPVPQDAETVGIEVPMSDFNTTEATNLPKSIANNSENFANLMSIRKEDLPASTRLPEDGTPGSISDRDTNEIPKVSGLQGTTIAQSSPSIPIDVTGYAPEPPTPIPNQTKKHKLKFKAQKVVRYTRRVVLPKSVLNRILGKQLAGPIPIALKAASKHGSGGFKAPTAVDPGTSGNVPLTVPGSNPV